MNCKKIFLVLLCLLVQSAYALFPVIDVHAIASMTKQLSQMKREYLAMKDLGSISKEGFSRVASDLSGQFSYGQLNNKRDDIQRRYGGSYTWGEWFDGSIANNKKYDDNHVLWLDQSWLNSMNKEEGNLLLRDLIRSRAVSIESSEIYDGSKNREEVLHHLSDRIDDSINAKAAMDLNSRLSVENQYAHNAELKQIAMLNKQLAEKEYQNIQEEQKELSFTSLRDNE